MRARDFRGVAATLGAFTFAATIAFAQVHVVGGPTPAKPAPQPVAAPQPGASAIPFAKLAPLKIALPGRVVSLAKLPPLPARTVANTITPQMLRAGKGRAHTLAANGETIVLNNGNCTALGGNGSIGALFNLGCMLQWQATGLSPNGDRYQDFAIAPNLGNPTNATATATGAVHGGPTGANNTTTLSAVGTWVLGIFDNTTGKWATVVYVEVGPTFNLQVFGDAGHTQAQYQFSASSSTDAFIFAQNLSPSDNYVVYAESTSLNPSCAFIAPTAAITANQLCNVNGSAGIQAPGGNLEITMPVSGLAAGTYSVVVYDLSQQERLGQVEISVTGQTGSITGGGVIIQTFPSLAGANPSPNPIPAATPSVIMAWDGPGTDQSTTGVTLSEGSAPSGNYIWTVTDPDGQVVGQNGTIAAPLALTGVSTQTFTFAGMNLNPPGQYPSTVFTAQLFDVTNNKTVASQSFQVLAYSTQSQFIVGGNPTTSLAITPGGSVTNVGLQITNNANLVYGLNAADTLSKIVFTTGPNFNANATGNGIMANLGAGACNPVCNGGTATDTNGNLWKVTITCTGTGAQPKGECTIEFDPQNPGTVLQPGASVKATGLTFTSDTNQVCGASCEGLTSELPAHGATFSSTSNTISWQPVFFTNNSAAHSGTASIKIIGSINPGLNSRLAGPPFTPPYVNTHFYQGRLLAADYSLETPFSITAASTDVYAVTLTNNGTDNISAIAFLLPPLLLNQGSFTIDTTVNNNWTASSPGNNPCTAAAVPNEANLSPQWVCLTGKAGHTLNPGKTETIGFDESAPLQSFPFVQMQAVALEPTQFTFTPAAGTTSTIDGSLTTLNNMSIGMYSLNGAEMGASFNPSTVGESTALVSTAANIQVTNTSLASDPNPDPVDAIVIQAANTVSNNGNPTIVSAPAGWQFLGTQASGGNTQWWFGLCAAQFTSPGTEGPPATNPAGAAVPALPECTTPESGALQPSQSATFGFALKGVTTAGTVPFQMFAHGANGNAWTQGHTFNLTVAAKTAQVAFTSVNGTAVAANAVPTITAAGAGSPNTYVYSITNTSTVGTTIAKVVITLPGMDIAGNNATDLAGSTWAIPSNAARATITNAGVVTLGGNVGTCAVDTTAANTFNPTVAGANGQITIKNCVLAQGQTLTVSFAAEAPNSQNDTYLFPASVDALPAVATYAGADEVQEHLAVGLNLVVNPATGIPGGASPVVGCATAPGPTTCTFSVAGSTIDFETPSGANTSNTFTDVVQATLTFAGASANGWNLSIEGSTNNAISPLPTLPAPQHELQIFSDATNSNTGVAAGSPITFDVTSATDVPTASTLQIAHTTKTVAGTFGLLQDFKLQFGNEGLNATTSVITYTLVAN